MNVSRVRKKYLRSPVWAFMSMSFIGMSLMMTANANAQNGPVDLSPPARLVPKTPVAPTPEMPTPYRPLQNDGGGDAVNPNTPIFGSVVESEVLGMVDPDVAGVLSQDEGGFGTDMWKGTQRTVLETLLTKMTVTTSSPAMRNLMHRMLLTGADVPQGGEPGTLIALRAGQLLAMGDFSGVNRLLKVLPGYAGNPDLLRIEVDARLLTGDVSRACQVASAFNENQDSIYWQKAFIFCQAIEGQGEQAQLGMSLLQELGVEDTVFYNLVDAIATQSEPPKIDSLSDPSPLHLALARVAKATLPADIISSNRPAVLRSIAISPNAAPQLRLEAAERAEAAGALPVDALRQLYASIEFSKQDLASPLTMASQLSGPMSRALLYRATLSQTVPSAQAEALIQALKMARLGGRYASTARAFLPQISRIEPSHGLLWFAPEAIRAFLATDRHDEARIWFGLLKAAAQNDSKVAAELESLLPLARLSGFAEASGWTTKQLPTWWQAVKSTDGALEKASTLTAVFGAMGESVPADMWGDLIQGPTHHSVLAPSPSLWFLLDSAAQSGRVGETVLVSLVVLGEGGPARADPMILQHVLTALRTINLTADARALALEAVIAAGL